MKRLTFLFVNLNSALKGKMGINLHFFHANKLFQSKSKAYFKTLRTLSHALIYRTIFSEALKIVPDKKFSE